MLLRIMLKKFCERGEKEREVARPRQAMLAVFDEGEAHIGAGDDVEKAKRAAPRNVRVLAAVQDADGHGERNGAGAEEMAFAVLDQRLRDRIGPIAIGRWPVIDPVA